LHAGRLISPLGNNTSEREREESRIEQREKLNRDEGATESQPIPQGALEFG